MWEQAEGWPIEVQRWLLRHSLKVRCDATGSSGSLQACIVSYFGRQGVPYIILGSLVSIVCL